jgi:uncharacterized protein (TIGR03435 family)
MGRRISMARVLVGLGMVFAACGMFGQPAVPAPAFEVASIRPNASASGNSSTHWSKGQISMENVSLKQCIEVAFDVKDYSLSGPSWLDNVRFDLLAKPPSGSPPGRSPGFLPPDFQAMLQTPLADRFKLAVHRETKVLSAYALLVDKRGPKIQPVEAGPSGTSSGRGLLTGKSVSMARFADILSANLDRPVKDMTDLQGVFNIKLTWTPDEPPAELGERRTTLDNPAAAPSLFAAVQEQLGLRIEARKLPVEVLVVDHAEKVPADN